MIAFAPTAAEKLRALRGDDPARAYLRLYVAGRSCCGYQYGLAFDSTTDPSDEVVETEGIPVAIDEQSRPYCEGATIEYVDENEYPGGGFRVTNTSLSSSCSCGH